MPSYFFIVCTIFYAHTCSLDLLVAKIFGIIIKVLHASDTQKAAPSLPPPFLLTQATTMSSCNFLIAITFFMLSSCCCCCCCYCWLLFCSDEAKAKWNLLLHLLRILRHSKSHSPLPLPLSMTMPANQKPQNQQHVVCMVCLLLLSYTSSSSSSSCLLLPP